MGPSGVPVGGKKKKSQTRQAIYYKSSFGFLSLNGWQAVPFLEGSGIPQDEDVCGPVETGCRKKSHGKEQQTCRRPRI